MIRVKRRRLLIVASAAFFVPAIVHGQRPSQPLRVGVLIDTPIGDANVLEVLFERLAANGFVKNRDVIIEVGSNDLDLAKIPELARKMVAANPNVILTTHEEWADALKRETSTIPIVFSFVSEPVERGYVLSLSRSGTNMVGVTDRGNEMTIKRMELLREAFPIARRLLVIAAFSFFSKAEIATIHKASDQLKFALIESDISGQSVEKVLKDARRERPDCVLPIGGMDIRPGEQGVKRLEEFVALSRIPIIYTNSKIVDRGGLMSLDIDRAENIRRSSDLVVKILKGSRPAEMPVEQAAKFEFVVNLKTAKALGLKISQSILVRANRVIE